MQHPSLERPVGHPSWWWASVVGLAFGATSSALNHLPAVGRVAWLPPRWRALGPRDR